MHVATGLLAVALTAAGHAPETPCPNVTATTAPAPSPAMMTPPRPFAAEDPSAGAGQISYEIVFIECEGLGWREAVQPRMQQIARMGEVLVWTADAGAFEALVETCRGDGKAVVTSAPKVTAFEGATASITDATTRRLATGVDRIADGPYGQATRVAYTPRFSDLFDGYRVDVAGRGLDQGTLLNLDLENNRVEAVEQVRLTETLVDPETGEEVEVHATIQQPKSARVAVHGEWLVPTDQHLVIGLGLYAFSSHDSQGRPETHNRDRLCVITPRRTFTEEAEQAVLNAPHRPVPAAPTPIARSMMTPMSMPMPMPAPAADPYEAAVPYGPPAAPFGAVAVGAPRIILSYREEVAPVPVPSYGPMPMGVAGPMPYEVPVAFLPPGPYFPVWQDAPYRSGPMPSMYPQPVPYIPAPVLPPLPPEPPVVPDLHVAAAGSVTAGPEADEVHRPMPAPPARNLPIGITPEGHPAPPPALPDQETRPASLESDGGAGPHPSPQANVPNAGPKAAPGPETFVEKEKAEEADEGRVLLGVGRSAPHDHDASTKVASTGPDQAQCGEGALLGMCDFSWSLVGSIHEMDPPRGVPGRGPDLDRGDGGGPGDRMPPEGQPLPSLRGRRSDPRNRRRETGRREGRTGQSRLLRRGPRLLRQGAGDRGQGWAVEVRRPRRPARLRPVEAGRRRRLLQGRARARRPRPPRRPRSARRSGPSWRRPTAKPVQGPGLLREQGRRGGSRTGRWAWTRPSGSPWRTARPSRSSARPPARPSRPARRRPRGAAG